jgi:hypothetical protein
MSRKRTLLFGVAGLLCASALLAIAILLVGRFGSTEGRILGSTALLAAYGIVAVPAAVLVDRGRRRELAFATWSLCAAGAALALAGIWSGSDTVGKLVGSVTAFALAGAQVSALLARRRAGDSALVRRVFSASCATGLVAAVVVAVFVWIQPNGSLFPRLFGSLVVLDLLLVALQPVLARTRPQGPTHRLHVVLATGETLEIVGEGGDVPTAVAQAMRRLERAGERVAKIEIG